jgi:hypothetical protein
LVEVGAQYLISIQHRAFILDELMLLTILTPACRTGSLSLSLNRTFMSDYINWQYILIVPHENPLLPSGMSYGA